MKHIYTSIFLFFFLQLSFGQIGFEDRLIFDPDDAHRASQVMTADIDNDGDLDLVLNYFKYQGGLAWYENIDGQTNFGSKKIIPISNSLTSRIDVGDINSDGFVDILCGFNGTKIGWLENHNGQGNFSENIIIDDINYFGHLMLVDTDGDNDKDIVFALENPYRIVQHRNIDGTGNFGIEELVANVANRIETLEVQDINDDGFVDFVVVVEDEISVIINSAANGLFEPSYILNSQQLFNVFDIDISDVDNDGDLDILTASSISSGVSSNGQIVWYENLNDSDLFGSEQIILDEGLVITGNVLSRDFDNDGDNDILIFSAFYQHISWFENIDDSDLYESEVILATDIKSWSTAYDYSIYFDSVDLGMDSDLDLVFATSVDDKFGWLENIGGDSTFDVIYVYTQELAILRLVSGDLDNDMLPEVIATNSEEELMIFKNQGIDRKFSPVKFLHPELPIRQFCVKDLNMDGNSEIVGGRFDIYLFEKNILDNNIEHTLTLDLLGNLKSLEVENIDGIFGNDIIACSTKELILYKSLDNQNNFAEKIIISSTDDADITDDIDDIEFIEDLDDDGDFDLICLQNNNTLVWLENTDGTGSFGLPQVIANRRLYNSPCDVDNDGDMDIISFDYDNDNILWIENDNYDFSTEHIIIEIPSNILSSGLTVADLDSDGDMDIIYTARTTESNAIGLYWLENIDGVGTFSEENVINNNDLFSTTIPIVDDMDFDGDMDIVLRSQAFFNVGAFELLCFENKGQTSNQINGKLIFDEDNSGCNDLDFLVSNMMITSESSSDLYSTFSFNNGAYQLFPNEGEYITLISSNLPSYFTINPISQISNFTGVGNTQTIDFCISANQSINDLNITIYPSIDEPRPGFDATYQLVYNNIGTTQLSGNVTFEFDDSKLQFLTVSETVSSQTANTLTFNFTDLNPFETRTIDLEFNIFPLPTTNIDDIINSTATINPISGDNTEEDNVFSLEQIVIGSYDPNDITVLEGEEILLEDADKYLHYLIRFQNTGTANAINVRVDNVLDDKLDWTTMQLESLSHNGRVQITDERYVEFIFNNINLPDSTNNEPNSHGFIAYKIKPKSDVALGDIFYNTADIFFDFNPAIVTNTVSTEIVEDNLSTEEFENSQFSIYPNPASTELNIKGRIVINNISIYDINGRLLKSKTFSSPKTEYQLNVSDLS